MRMVPPKRQRLARVEPARVEYVPLGGGEDLVSPALSIPPGALRYSLNYEPGQAMGYRRLDGFERLDGQLKPSAASYWILHFDGGDNEPSVGATAIGSTSGATGEVRHVVVTSGSWAGNDAAGYLVLVDVAGTFIDDEPLTYSQPAAFSSGFSGGFA